MPSTSDPLNPSSVRPAYDEVAQTCASRLPDTRAEAGRVLRPGGHLLVGFQAAD